MRPEVDPNLETERLGATSIIRVNRPAKKNALTAKMLTGIGAALKAEHESGATAVVLTGGTEIFSAGADLETIGHGAKDIEIDDLIAELIAVIAGLPIPVIAAIEGDCIGAALEIALSCDVRVASRTSSFSIPVVRLGVLYRPDGIANILANVGMATATRLLVLGEAIFGADAVLAGIASHVVEPKSALDEALKLARLTEVNIPAAVSATKKLLLELNSSKVDLSDFDQVRNELLSSEARLKAVADLQVRLGR